MSDEGKLDRVVRSSVAPKNPQGVARCTPCNGTGNLHQRHETLYRRCALCSGTGVIPE